MTDDTDLRPTMREAIAEIRWEERKAALIYAAVDAAFVGATIGFIGAFVDLRSMVAVDVPAGVSPTTLLAVGASLLVLSVEFVYRLRRPPCDLFESYHFEVDPALRTARDVSTAGHDQPMAQKLYGDVLQELRGASSTKMLRGKRLAVPLLVAMLFSLGTVQLAAVGLDLGAVQDAATSPNDPSAVMDAGNQPINSELQDGSQVLGNATNVSAGSDPLNATVSATGGSGEGSVNPDNTQSLSSSAGPSQIDAPRTGFSDPGEIENGELIKEYNIAVREDQNDE